MKKCILTVLIGICLMVFPIYASTNINNTEKTNNETKTTSISYDQEYLEEDELEFKELPISEELFTYLEMRCDQAEIPISLMLGLMEIESNFNPNAISDDGENYGLCQINIINQKPGLNYLDPYTNIDEALNILEDLSTRHDSYLEILLCYNMGEAGAQARIETNDIQSEYVIKVQKAWYKWLEMEI